MIHLPTNRTQLPNSDLPQLSFTNLVEAHVLRIVRETHQVKLDKVREALDYMSQQFDTSHPLVEKKFQTDGGDDIEDIADEFDCTPEQVTAAIEFENLLAA